MIGSQAFFASMCFLIFLNFTTYALPLSFYPALADSLGFSKFAIGFVFSISSVGSLICSFMLGKFMRFLPKDSLMLIFQIINSISTFLFGFMTLFMESHFLFYFLSVVLRFVNGFSMGGIFTVVYSLVPDYWPDDISRRIAFLEISISFGIGMGPVINAAVYHFFGFSTVFLFSGAYTLLFGLLTIKNFIHTEKGKTLQNVEKTLSLKKIISDPGLVVCFLFLALNYDSLALTFPTFETHLIGLGCEPSIGGLIWSLSQLGYILGIFLCNYLNKYFQAKNIFIAGSICCSFCLILLGPDPILNIESNSMKILLIIISMFAMGTFLSLILLLMIPEFILLLGKLFPNENELNGDMGSGLFSASLSTSEIVGPLIGGLLNDFFGFERGCSVFSLILVFFLCIYIKTFSADLCNNKKGREEVKEIEINLM